MRRWLLAVTALCALAVAVVALVIGNVRRGPPPLTSPPGPTPSTPSPAPGSPSAGPGYSLPELAPPRATTDHGVENSQFELSDSVLRLSGEAWTQSARKGNGDLVVKVRSSGNSTVRGGYIRGDYPSTWTWSYLKTEAHYNGAAFALTRAAGDLTFDGQYTDNVAVDAYRIVAAPASLTIANNYSFNNRDDFVSYPAEAGALRALTLRANLVHTFTWLSWRHTGRNDSATGRFRLEMAGNLVHLKPQAGTGTCRSARRDGRVAGRPFKMDSGFRGSRDLFDIHDNIFWIEEGPRDGCSHVWPTATYRNNVIYYSGRERRQSKYLGEVPAGIRVLRGAAGKAAWDERVAQWLRQRRAYAPS